MSPRIIKSAIWFILAIIFFKFIGLDELMRDRTIKSWPIYEVEINKVELKEIVRNTKQQLVLTFSAEIDSELHSWTDTYMIAKVDELEALTQNKIKEGKFIKIHVNPENQEQFSYPTMKIGRWLLGFVSSAIFLLLSIGSFLSTEEEEDPKLNEA